MSPSFNIPTRTISQIVKPLFCDFYWEALQFEVAMSQLRTFNMDLHPQTHLQLKIPVLDISCLSVMQIFISIGNHLHKGINKNKTHLRHVALKLRR